MARLVVARWACLALVALAPATRADPTSAQAEVMFRNGKRLLKLGKVAEACAAFDASEKLGPTISTRLNQANCREKNNQLATAWGLFLDAERDTRSATDDVGKQLHQVAVEHADKLEPRLSTLEIRVPAEARADGLEITRDDAVLDAAVWNQALPIDGGTYKITARGKNVPAWSTTVTIANEKDFKVVELPRRAAPARTESPTPPVATAAPPPAKSFDAPDSWYCTGSVRSKIGICKPQLDQCSAFRARLLAHVRDLSECAAEWTATCFQVGNEAHCAPNAEICEAMRDAATRAGTAMVGTCDAHNALAPRAVARAPVKATGAVSDVDFDEPRGPVWWCTESAHSPAGTCKPVLAQCQAYRKKLMDKFLDLTECHTYLKALCFDLGKEAHCAPNAEICNALREAAGVGGKCTARAAK